MTKSIEELNEIEYLKYKYRYDPHTGAVYFLNGYCNRVGKQAKSTCKDGYIILSAFRNGKEKKYSAHRVGWLLHYGKWPDNFIDHINGIANDNRICNLRDVLPVENQHNLYIHRAGKLVGSSYSKAERKWKAQIKINGKSVYLGSFKNEIDAHNMYKAALRNKDKYKGSDSVFRLKLTKADQMLKEMGIE